MRNGPVIAIYPGSFDPITLGHMDIISRCAQLFHRVIPTILVNSEKRPLFSLEERMEMVRVSIADIPHAAPPTHFEGLTVDAARRCGATVIVRGIRAVSDYEYELQMALMNRKLASDIETVFLVPGLRYSFISSRLVKDLFSRGGFTDGLVPDVAADMLKAKFSTDQGGDGA